MNYDNTNRGGIWKNDRKEKDTHPDFTGNLNVDGVEYWVNAWKRKADSNPKAAALSFSVKRKDEQQAAIPPAQNQAAQPTTAGDFADDDIPF